MAILDRINSALNFEEPIESGYGVAVAQLRTVVDALDEKMRVESGQKIRVALEPGYPVNLGQQLNVVLRFDARADGTSAHDETLFRAYVPREGYPMALDFYGEEAERANDQAEMENRIVDFLATREVRDRLRTYVKLSASS